MEMKTIIKAMLCALVLPAVMGCVVDKPQQVTLTEALADFCAFSAPEAFVLFGGLTKSGEYLLKPIREALYSNVLGIFSDVKLLVSELKESDAAVLGASALGWEAKEV